MDLTPVIAIAVFAVIAIVLNLIRSESQHRKETWGAMTEQLGLENKGGALLGEYEGVSVRIATEMRRTPGGYVQFFVVRAKVPGELPSGFVAAPRPWTSGLDRMLADNLLAMNDPALKECYVCQSDQLQAGQALIDHAEVRKALLKLYSPSRVGFVEKNRTHVAYEGFLSDVEEVRSALKDVVHAARTLAVVHEQLTRGPATQASA